MKRGRQRLLIPEVVQTSSMDCGPASLKCLLEGFGVPVSYGRLREACQTDVDGTSIDTLEDIAGRLGLAAEQTMLPVNTLLLSETEALPALVVMRQPGGFTHFVVVSFAIVNVPSPCCAISTSVFKPATASSWKALREAASPHWGCFSPRVARRIPVYCFLGDSTSRPLAGPPGGAG